MNPFYHRQPPVAWALLPQPRVVDGAGEAAHPLGIVVTLPPPKELDQLSLGLSKPTFQLEGSNDGRPLLRFRLLDAPQVAAEEDLDLINTHLLLLLPETILP